MERDFQNDGKIKKKRVITQKIATSGTKYAKLHRYKENEYAKTT